MGRSFECHARPLRSAKPSHTNSAHAATIGEVGAELFHKLVVEAEKSAAWATIDRRRRSRAGSPSTGARRMPRVTRRLPTERYPTEFSPSVFQSSGRPRLRCARYVLVPRMPWVPYSIHVGRHDTAAAQVVFMCGKRTGETSPSGKRVSAEAAAAAYMSQPLRRGSDPRTPRDYDLEHEGDEEDVEFYPAAPCSLAAPCRVIELAAAESQRANCFCALEMPAQLISGRLDSNQRPLRPRRISVAC